MGCSHRHLVSANLGIECSILATQGLCGLQGKIGPTQDNQANIVYHQVNYKKKIKRRRRKEEWEVGRIERREKEEK